MMRTEEIIKYNPERGCYEREFVEVEDYNYTDEVEILRAFNEERLYFINTHSNEVGYQ